MYFYEEEVAGESGCEEGDSYLQKVEGAVSQTIARAIRDATQGDDVARQHEAASWLMICCPDIAEQIELPYVDFEKLPGLATAYMAVEGGF